MRSDIITVSNSGEKMEEALAQAEKVAVYKELPKKSALHLRLLTEEALGMLRSVTRDMQGSFWIEDNDGVFEIHLTATSDMDLDRRNKLISASTSGKNEAAKGLMGKIRSFFEPVDDIPVLFDMTMVDTPGMADMTWSMSAYQAQLEQYVEQKLQGAAEAWDELEKSVVSNVADDVKVSVKGREVEMVICKKMG